jgi:hypothetical protein
VPDLTVERRVPATGAEQETRGTDLHRAQSPAITTHPGAHSHLCRAPSGYSPIFRGLHHPKTTLSLTAATDPSAGPRGIH